MIKTPLAAATFGLLLSGGGMVLLLALGLSDAAAGLETPFLMSLGYLLGTLTTKA